MLKIISGIQDYEGTTQEKAKQLFEDIGKHFIENSKDYSLMFNDETAFVKVSFKVDSSEVITIDLEKQNFIKK